MPLQRHSSVRQTGKQGRYLRILLLSGSDVRDDAIDETVQRIGHFTSLSGAVDIAIIFLLQEAPSQPESKLPAVQGTLDRGSLGVLEFSKLQSVLLGARDVPPVPLLPTVNLEGIPKLIKDHARALGQPSQVSPPVTKAIDLLPASNVGSAMSPFALSLTSEVFSSLKELGKAAFMVGNDDRLGMRDHDSSPHVLQTGGSAPDGRLVVLRDQLGTEAVDAMVEFWIEEWTAP